MPLPCPALPRTISPRKNVPSVTPVIGFSASGPVCPPRTLYAVDTEAVNSQQRTLSSPKLEICGRTFDRPPSLTMDEDAVLEEIDGGQAPPEHGVFVLPRSAHQRNFGECVTLHSSMATKMVIQKVVTRLRGRTLKNSPAAPAMPDPKTTHDAVWIAGLRGISAGLAAWRFFQKLPCPSLILFRGVGIIENFLLCLECCRAPFVQFPPADLLGFPCPSALLSEFPQSFSEEALRYINE
jgi:hypothetical protein